MKHDLSLGTTRSTSQAEPSQIHSLGLVAWMRRRIESWLKRLDSRFGF